MKLISNVTNIKKGHQLSLPAVQSFLRLGKTAIITQQLVDPNIATILDFQTVSRAEKYSHTLVTLNDGSNLVWKNNGQITLKEDQIGVVKTDAAGKIRWSQHRELYRRFPNNTVDEYQRARKQAFESWDTAFLYLSDNQLRNVEFNSGLHRHQLGAIHALGAHWSIFNERATIVMPTGTGKSDTMIAGMVAYVRGTLIVAVPSVALRNQTFNKFLSLGLLRQLGHIKSTASNPVVGILTGRIKTAEDLLIFDCCNVVITTISMIAQGTAEGFGSGISARCSHLMIDEAHHIPARTWANFRDSFATRPTLQLTATPFRRDKKLIDGQLIYRYSLAQAQADGFFKDIIFYPVSEPDLEAADKAIANATVKVLRQDLANGLDHIALARTSKKTRANEIFSIYKSIASDLNPIVVYSGKSDTQEKIAQLRAGKSRIVVCVDMLGEGFDLPQLKIAAIHDSYKSLAILLQFIGRFTRTLGAKLGSATVVANSAHAEITETFEELYNEDADWNTLLRNYASQAIKDYAESIKLLEEAEPIELTTEKLRDVELSPSSLKPKFSTVVYECNSFRPKLFAKGLPLYRVPHSAWHNHKSNLFFFVTAENPHIDWSNSRSLLELHWHFYVLYYNSDKKLLFIHSSDNTSLHSDLAEAVGGNSVAIVNGENIFRVFAGIKRLLLHTVGLKRRITGRNLRFSQHMGADVGEALSSAQTSSSTKSNIYATGYENGDRINVGCSYKGRIWTREQGSLKDFLSWCNNIGHKLLDTTFDTTQLISDALIYEEITEFPEVNVLALLWPDELWHKSENNVKFMHGTSEVALFDTSLEFISTSKQELQFAIVSDSKSIYSMKLLPNRKVSISHLNGPSLVLSFGRHEHDLAAWFSENPPEIHFIDGSELDGTLWIHPQKRKTPSLPQDSFDVWDWSKVDLTCESMWHAGKIRTNSIQYNVANVMITKFDVVFDDDGSGEAADLVCIKNDLTQITIHLIHCKFSGGEQVGTRVKDVVELCSQAVRSHKWKHKLEALCNHLQNRDRSAGSSQRKTRFIQGTLKDLRAVVAAARQKPVIFNISVVQPGLAASNVTAEQHAVLAAAHTFLLETVDVQMKVICSK